MPIALLFIVTGVLPIKYRQLNLVLWYIQYLSKLPLPCLARIAFEDAKTLWGHWRQGWLGDIDFVLRTLPGEPLLALPPADHIDDDAVGRLVTAVKESILH